MKIINSEVKNKQPDESTNAPDISNNYYNIQKELIPKHFNQKDSKNVKNELKSSIIYNSNISKNLQKGQLDHKFYSQNLGQSYLIEQGKGKGELFFNKNEKNINHFLHPGELLKNQVKDPILQSVRSPINQIQLSRNQYCGQQVPQLISECCYTENINSFINYQQENSKKPFDFNNNISNSNSVNNLNNQQFLTSFVHQQQQSLYQNDNKNCSIDSPLEKPLQGKVFSIPQANFNNNLGFPLLISKNEQWNFPSMENIHISNLEKGFSRMINLKCEELEINIKPTLDLICAIDISKSMAGEKLAILKRSFQTLFEICNEKDRITLYTFNESAKKIVPLVKMTLQRKQELLELINSLAAKGKKDISRGFKAAFTKVKKLKKIKRKKNKLTSIMIFSDAFTKDFTSNTTSVENLFCFTFLF
jgi:hypothetical protein